MSSHRSRSRARAGSGSRSRSGGSRSGSGRSGGGGRSRSSGGRGRSSGGRRPPPRRSGGGGGATATIVAALLLAGVVGIFLIMSGNKKKGPNPNATSPTELTADSGKPKEEPVDNTPKRAPPPEVDAAMRATVKEVAARIKVLAEKAQGVYDAAMAAKREGNIEAWQDGLSEAIEICAEARDIWNDEVIQHLPHNEEEDWDQEQVCNHYFQREERPAAKAGEIDGLAKKQLRMKK